MKDLDFLNGKAVILETVITDLKEIINKNMFCTKEIIGLVNTYNEMVEYVQDLSVQLDETEHLVEVELSKMLNSQSRELGYLVFGVK